MSSWRDRLCGSVAMKNANEESDASLQQFLNPNESISCGGGFYPTHKNMANMQTYNRNSFVLPTHRYSVLVFKDDGSAVIYSDVEPKYTSDEVDFAEKFKLS